MVKIQNLPYLIILFLVAVIFIQHGCSKNDSVTSKSTHDTIIKDSIIHIHDTITSKPIIIKSIPDTTWDSIPIYIPDTNYNKLRLQYESLGNKFFEKNISIQPIKLDTFGTATIIDTVQQNKIIGTSFRYSINIPVKTITITNTIQQPQVNQLYIGGNVSGNANKILTGVGLNLLFKNKQDQIYQAGVEQLFDGTHNYTIGTYFKIKL